MDPNTNTPIVVLKGTETDSILPIWVGAFEANAIALEIEKIVPQRPMTHDLLKNLIIQSGSTASRVIITELLENTFYASIELIDRQGKTLALDARPSDAIALALRLDCPIFVRDEVLTASAASTIAKDDVISSGGEAASTEDWPDLID